MRCPGFALLAYDDTKRTVTLIRKSHVNNKAAKKTHGQILSEIAKELRSYLQEYPDALLIREKALAMVSLAAKTIQILHKVIGVTDLYAWACGQREFIELAPSTIKSVVAGDKDATKDAVAAGVEPYVGPQAYVTDDESDAVAVGIAWLIKEKKIEKQGAE